MSQLEVLRVRNLSGGRNTRDSLLALPDSMSSDDLNLVARNVGSIEKREGAIRFQAGALTAKPILGLHGFYRSDGHRFLLQVAGGELGYADGENGEQLIPIEGGFVNCQPWSFATLQDWCFMGNFADLVYRWDGETLYQAGLAEPSVPAGATYVDASDPDGQMAVGSYEYKILAKYPRLGPSNLISTSLSTGVAGLNNCIDLAGFDLPPGATSLGLYRTLVNPPSNPDLRIFYYVTDFTTSYRDLKGDDELLVEYEGDVAKPFNAAYLAAHRNRMWYGYCMERDASSSYPSRVAYSKLYQPDRLGGFVDVFPQDGDVVTGIIAYRGNLVVFKRRQIYQILGSSELDFEVRNTHTDRGCVAPMSIASVDNKIFFLSEDGVYVFDGAQTYRVSDPIRPDLESLTPLARLWASAGSHRGRYLLSVEL